MIYSNDIIIKKISLPLYRMVLKKISTSYVHKSVGTDFWDWLLFFLLHRTKLKMK